MAAGQCVAAGSRAQPAALVRRALSRIRRAWPGATGRLPTPRSNAPPGGQWIRMQPNFPCATRPQGWCSAAY
ncbi:hypothetical protein CEJ63_23070 [Acinetobacter baumannii]|nr:hypothetical protein CEJ63_23070 [Acinetobacter baumannii]